MPRSNLLHPQPQNREHLALLFEKLPPILGNMLRHDLRVLNVLSPQIPDEIFEAGIPLLLLLLRRTGIIRAELHKDFITYGRSATTRKRTGTEEKKVHTCQPYFPKMLKLAGRVVAHALREFRFAKGVAFGVDGVAVC